MGFWVKLILRAVGKGAGETEQQRGIRKKIKNDGKKADFGKKKCDLGNHCF